MIETYFSIIVSLFILEVLLSIDNALVNATIANNLPEHKRKLALRIGIICGGVFRLLMLFIVSYIIANPWLKIAGGLYLVYLMISHIGRIVDDNNHEIKKKDGFFAVITQIIFADIVFSLDNVISAVSFSNNIIIVIIGVMIGVISMLFVTPILSKLIHKYKGLPQAAYVIVGFIGITLILETMKYIHISEFYKFLVILLVIIWTIVYEHSLIIRRVSDPIFKRAQYIIAIPLDIILVIKNEIVRVIGRLR